MLLYLLRSGLLWEVTEAEPGAGFESGPSNFMIHKVLAGRAAWSGALDATWEPRATAAAFSRAGLSLDHVP